MRNIQNKRVLDKDLKNILENSRHTPSVCNRRDGVRIFMTIKHKKLKYQNGNRGFGHNFKTVILVTGDNTSFNHIERNQMFVDGGLFSMS